MLLCAAAAFLLFRMAICRKTKIRRSRKRKHKEETPAMKAYREGMEEFSASHYETHTITSYDGLKLAGHYLSAPVPEPACILLCIHGYRSSSFKEYGIYKNFYHDRLQADMMCPDQRAHGESEGKYICYGVKERRDVLDWINYLNRLSAQRYGKILPIYLHGISMGCATVLMARELGYPENVKGIIADCGYTSPDAIFRHIVRHSFHLPCFPILNLAELFTRCTAGFGFREASTKHAQNNELPILFIHGDQDHFVPTTMSLENYEAYTGKKRLLIVKGAAHAVSYYMDRDSCEQAIRELIASPQSF